MRGLLTPAAISLAVASALTADTPAGFAAAPEPDTVATDSVTYASTGEEVPDSLVAEMSELIKSVLAQADADKKSADRYETLSDEDFRVIADELGVETAAIKAVVKIEAGPALRGFWAPGVPVVNYAQSLFNKYNAKIKGPKAKDAKVPEGLSGYALKEWTSLTRARKINEDAANMSCYWGMFQIGGYNYQLCGCESIAEMVALMSESEFSQLELFAEFVRKTGMLESLRKKDWTTFARKYNGSSYAKRGYHTRMAKEYEAFKAKEKKPASKAGTKTSAKTDTINKSQPETASGKTTAKRTYKKRSSRRR